MISVSVSELNAHWREAQKALATEQEVILTRDGEPVGRLLPLAKPIPVAENKTARKRFSPAAHRKWQESVFGKGVVVNWVDEFMEKGREDREF